MAAVEKAAFPSDWCFMLLLSQYGKIGTVASKENLKLMHVGGF